MDPSTRSPASRVADNFRDLSDCCPSLLRKGLIFRSSTPWCANSNDVQWLVDDLKITTVLDLRTDFERTQTDAAESQGDLCRQTNVRVVQAALISQSAMGQYLFSVADWTTRCYMLGTLLGVVTPESISHRINPLIARGGLLRMYISIVEDTQTELLKCFETMLHGVPMVVHCTSGKDRTGVLCALVLNVCGVKDAVVFEDYHQTELYVQELFANPKNPTVAHFGSSFPEMQLAPKEIMKQLFQHIRVKYNSVEEYVDVVLGFGKDNRRALVNKLVKPMNEERGVGVEERTLASPQLRLHGKPRHPCKL